jgi:hypothetical protein
MCNSKYILKYFVSNILQDIYIIYYVLYYLWNQFQLYNMSLENG